MEQYVPTCVLTIKEHLHPCSLLGTAAMSANMGSFIVDFMSRFLALPEEIYALMKMETNEKKKKASVKASTTARELGERPAGSASRWKLGSLPEVQALASVKDLAKGSQASADNIQLAAEARHKSQSNPPAISAKPRRLHCLPPLVCWNQKLGIKCQVGKQSTMCAWQLALLGRR